MFRKKKSSESGLVAPAERRPVLRGRDAAAPAAGSADNPLARRFRPEREPATIDLTAPARFQLPSAADGDPHTAAPQTDLPQLARVVSRDPQTGKFYVHPGHPGGDQSPVLLQGATLAPGRYTFAVQFNQGGKRSAADDSYVARVTGDSKDAKVSGGFAPN